jgi:hypothetical protein
MVDDEILDNLGIDQEEIDEANEGEGVKLWKRGGDKAGKLSAISAADKARADFGLEGNVKEDPVWTNCDRPRGAFTKRDREYLKSPNDFEGQTEREIRYRIRNRLKNLFYDAYFLYKVSGEELTNTFESIGPTSQYLARDFFEFGLRSLQSAVDSEGEFRDRHYEDVVEDAIHTAESRKENNSDSEIDQEGLNYTLISVSADIEIERKKFEGNALREKILEGNATQEEFETYWERGSRRRLVGAAENRGVSEIAVTDNVGMTATYDVDQLREELGDGRELTVEELIFGEEDRLE